MWPFYSNIVLQNRLKVTVKLDAPKPCSHLLCVLSPQLFRSHISTVGFSLLAYIEIANPFHYYRAVFATNAVFSSVSTTLHCNSRGILLQGNILLIGSWMLGTFDTTIDFKMHQINIPSHICPLWFIWEYVLTKLNDTLPFLYLTIRYNSSCRSQAVPG